MKLQAISSLLVFVCLLAAISAVAQVTPDQQTEEQTLEDMFIKLKAEEGDSHPPARCCRAHRFSGLPFPTGPRVPPARCSRRLLRKPTTLGLEEAPHPAGAEIRPQDAGHLPV